MGFATRVASRIRSILSFDKEGRQDNLVKGTKLAAPDSYNMLSTFGYDALSDWLKIEYDLMARFVDYEEMDEYPEVACFTGDSPVSILESDGVKSVRMDDLVGRDEVIVFAVDLARKKTIAVKTKGAKKTGVKVPVFEVTYEQYRANPGKPKEQWSLRVTANQLFMLRDGSYRPVGSLMAGDRLMPFSSRISKNGYLEIRDQWETTPAGGGRWHAVHVMVAEELLLGGLVPTGSVVHHENGDKSNPHPSNLKIETLSDHTREHAATRRPEVVAKIRESATTQWADPVDKLRMVQAQTAGRGGVLAQSVLKNSNPTPAGVLSDEHRKKIAEAHTIPLATDVVEAAVRTSASLSEASRKLGVSWNTLVRRMEKNGLSAAMLGTAVQSIAPTDSAYENHRVVSVEPAGFEDVYDLEIPGYHNFVCNGVVVHNSALNIVADDATQPDTVRGKTVWIDSEDIVIKERLTDLFDRTLRIEEEIWEITRTVAKYGNDYEEMIITEDEGVVGLNFMPPPTVRRVEGAHGELVGFCQDLRAQFAMTPEDFEKLLDERGSGDISTPEYAVHTAIPFNDWEVVHFRMRGKHRRSIYGFGFLESARFIWKRLNIMEDSALIYRLSRAPSRYAFYVDVGTLPPREAMGHVNRFKNQLKKQKFIDPQTGKLNLKFNPLAYDEDFFVPVRDGKKSAEIDTIAGPSWQHMEDIEYFRAKMFAALTIPKTYLNYDDAMGKGKGTLSQEDVRFARTILRIQREIKNGLKKVGRVHLAALGIDSSESEYDVQMTVPSAIFELAQLEVKNAKLDFAEKIRAYVSEYWIMSKVLGFSDDEIRVIESQKLREHRRKIAMGLVVPGEQSESKRERQMFAGNRDHEKMLEDHFEKFMVVNTDLARRIDSVNGLMSDLRDAVGPRRAA